jgi:carboxymethylenebutenolidase
MSRTDLQIETAEGVCPAWLFTPDTEGAWPGVIFYMDGVAIRPALFAMADRLAAHGYAVLLPDLFYRSGPWEPFDPATAFSPGPERERRMKLMATTGNAPAARDTAAFLDFLANEPRVAGAKVGCTGYCMGGGMALTAAGTYPDRIAAAAAFHGGRLATDAPDSPHLLAPRMKARIYVAGADQDVHFPAEEQARLDAALTAAGVDHVVETYPGALHGFTMPDLPVYDREAAERHWRELLALFAATVTAD